MRHVLRYLSTVTRGRRRPEVAHVGPATPETTPPVTPLAQPPKIHHLASSPTTSIRSL